MPSPMRWDAREIRLRRAGLARVGSLKAGDHSQQGRLARAARAEDGDDLTVGDVERRIVERGSRRRSARRGSRRGASSEPPAAAHAHPLDHEHGDDVTAMSTTASAYACATFSSPGRPRKRKIATGSVGRSGRARNTVAPNSPSEIANAKPAATASPRETIGRSISRRTRPGDAPSSAAASRWRGSIERSVGATIRTTNGIATSACATGTIHGAARKSRGSVSKAMRKPRPSITAEAPSGSRTSPSSSRDPRSSATANAASPPTTTAIDGRNGRIDDRVHDRFPRSDEEHAGRSSERPVRVEPVCRRSDCERPFDEDCERQPEEEREPAEAEHRRRACLAVVRTRRSVSRSARS